MTRLLYPSIYDSNDVHAWSGLLYHIAQALTAQGFEVLRVGPLTQRRASLFKAKQAAYRLLGQRHIREFEPVILDGYARQIGRILNSVTVDAIFCATTNPVARFESRHPLIFWGDAPFPAIIDYYPSFSNVSRSSIKNAFDLEKRALAQCAAAIYASEWAAQYALEELGADPAKVHVIPFGANLEDAPSEIEIETLISNRSLETCRLLFLGVDWERKGGPLAVEVAAGLNNRGLKTELVVAGCQPPRDLPNFVRREGFVSKATVRGRLKLAALIGESNFLILPSRAEAFGVVLAEACAYGLPCLATRTGGIPTIVRDGVNGYTFGPDEPAEAYVGAVLRAHAQAGAYGALARSAYHEYATRLNWGVIGRQVAELVHRVTGTAPSPRSPSFRRSLPRPRASRTLDP
jgi:glycosyltransferase involved in cell wall biosynthesis